MNQGKIGGANSVPISTQHLMLLQQANLEAWQTTVEVCRAQLRRDIRTSLKYRCLSADLVDDIEQATWATAARRIKEFTWQDAASFYHWLRVISFNHVRRAYAVQRRLSETSWDALQEQEFISLALRGGNTFYQGYSESPEHEVMQREQMQLLQQALATLRPKEADIVRRWMHGESRQTIAAKYSISPGAISMVINRSAKKLRPLLKMLL